MQNKIHPGLKIASWLYASTSGIFGLISILRPQVWSQVTGGPAELSFQDTFTIRLIGVYCLSIAIVLVLALQSGNRGQLKTLILLNILTSGLFLLLLLFGLILGELPGMFWSSVVFMLLCLTTFGYYYFKV